MAGAPVWFRWTWIKWKFREFERKYHGVGFRCILNNWRNGVRKYVIATLCLNSSAPFIQGTFYCEECSNIKGRVKHIFSSPLRILLARAGWLDTTPLLCIYPQRKAFHSPSSWMMTHISRPPPIRVRAMNKNTTDWLGLVCVFIGALSLWSFFFPPWTFIMSLRFFPRFLITFVYLRMRWLGSTSWLLLVVRWGVDDEGGWM